MNDIAKVCVSCGLTTDVDGKLIVDTGNSSWPYGCEQSEGSDLYCDSESGRLHGPPPIEWSYDEEFNNSTFSAVAVPASESVVDTTALDSEAPGVCQQVVGRFTEFEFQTSLSIPDGTKVQGYYSGDLVWEIVNQTGTTMTINSPQIGRTFFRTVVAGDVSGQVTFSMSQSGAGGATYTRLQRTIRQAYITTMTP